MRAVDVVVVGGGAMGSVAAWQLARRGAEVVQLEQFEPGHARGSSHGRARIVRLAYTDPFYVDLAAAALERWDQLEDEAGERLRVVTGAVDHGDPETVMALAGALTAGGHGVEWLSAREAGLRWPGLAFEEPVLYQPQGGRADADRTVAVLQRLARQHGAEVRHDAPVTGLNPDPDSVQVGTPAGSLRARQVVVAAGAWTPRLVAGHLPFPRLTVTREQPALFQPREWSDPWPSFIHHQRDAATRAGVSPRGAFGLASPNGVKVGFHAVGPEVEPSAEPAAPDGARLRELQEYVARWAPGLDPASADPEPCLYELTGSGDFVIDRVGPLTVAGGFSGHGFKFVPEIGRIVADLVLEGGFVPDRFRLAAHRRG
jgi:sarcosine oxidase